MKLSGPSPPLTGIVLSAVLHAALLFYAAVQNVARGPSALFRIRGETEIELITPQRPLPRDSGETFRSLPAAESVLEDVRLEQPAYDPVFTAKADTPAAETAVRPPQPVTHESIFLSDPYYQYRLPPAAGNVLQPDTAGTVPVRSPVPLAGTRDFPPPEWGADRIERDIHTRNTGSARLIPLSDILREAAKKLFKGKERRGALRMDFIPSDAQLEALNVIWDSGAATDQAIYAGIDTALRTTSADLNRALKRMADRGVLTRKIVSPRNELTVMTPLGSRQIEMSAKNRRNRVYEYRPHITRDEMVIYLQAVLTQVSLRESPAASNALPDKLKEKILRIVRPRE